MTNDDVRALIGDCYDRLMSAYPITDNSVDPRLAMAIGFAAGALSEGLAAEREGRQVRTDSLGSGLQETFTEEERRRLLQLAIDAVPIIAGDDELTRIISRLSGTDTVLVARRAYASRGSR